MSKSYKRSKDKRDGDRYVALPHVVIDSPSYRALGYAARALLLDIARQYTGSNNGKLVACAKYLKPMGWRSHDTVSRALTEVKDAGLLIETRMGMRPNRAAWFALGWYGAGRPSYKVKAEQLQKVDIGLWHRGDYLHAGRSFTWSWHRGDEPTGNIGVLVHGADSLALQYMVGSDDQRRDGSQTIWLAYTACNYGKSRPWFACPVCQRRVGVLYMRAGRFAWRHCQRVAYSSQSGDMLDRMWRKQSKLEARLGEHWQRPKGMRLKTYDRIMEVVLTCEERREQAFAHYAARLLSLEY